MIDFPIVKIGELIESGEAEIQTGPFGTQLKASDYSDHGYPVINVRNVGFGDVRTERLEFIDDRIAVKLPTHRLMQNDIVFGRKGAVERHGLITEAQEGWYQGSDCLRLRFNSSRIKPKFISYFFRTQAHQDWMMAVCAFGATMASLNQDIVKLINVPVPPIGIQNKIVGLLSTYDDLIENNKRRITLLENMAEEIYREWFVRFRFPGWREAEFEKGYPASWHAVKFDEFCKLKRGYDLPDSKVMDGPYPVLASTSVKTFHSEYKVKAPVITTGRSGSLGTVLFKRENCWPLNTTLYVQNFKGNSPFFVYFTLKNMPLETFNSGAGVPSLNRNHLAGLPVVVPDEAAQKAFDDVVGPIFRQVDTLQEQSEHLLKTKAQLLPRLISGKLSVENLDIQLPPSMQSDQPDRADEAAA